MLSLRPMSSGDTPLRKRFRPRGPFSRAHGAVFVDESNHFSVGPCHPHLILLFDIDLRGLRIGVAHRHRDVGHGDTLVVGQRGPGVARDIGAERLAEARLACHLAQQTVVAAQGSTIEACGLLALGIVGHERKEAVAIHPAPPLQDLAHTGLQADADLRARLLSAIGQMTIPNSVLAQHGNIYERHAHRIETKEKDVLGELALPVVANIEGAHAPDLGHGDGTLRGGRIAREDVGKEVYAASDASHPIVEGTEGPQIAGAGVAGHALRVQPAVVAHHELARKGGIGLTRDGEIPFQRSQGGLVIVNSTWTAHAFHLPHLATGELQKRRFVATLRSSLILPLWDTGIDLDYHNALIVIDYI